MMGWRDEKEETEKEYMGVIFRIRSSHMLYHSVLLGMPRHSSKENGDVSVLAPGRPGHAYSVSAAHVKSVLHRGMPEATATRPVYLSSDHSTVS
jgi:hypothetical protein